MFIPSFRARRFRKNDRLLV